MIAITQTRHLELLQAERDHARRELRKVFGFTAMYCGDPSVKVGVNINTAGEAKIVVIEDFQDQPTPQVDPELNAEYAAAGEHEVPKRLKYKKPETRHFGYREPEA